MLKSSRQYLGVCLIAFVLLGMMTHPVAAQNGYQSSSDELALLFCGYVRANDSTNFRNKLRELRLRLRDIYTGVRCNQSSMIQFAAVNNAIEVGRFIAHSVLIQDLEQAGDLQWLEQVGIEHPIAAALHQRIDAKLQE